MLLVSLPLEDVLSFRERLLLRFLSGICYLRPLGCPYRKAVGLFNCGVSSKFLKV
jgi:hypothetical protein